MEVAQLANEPSAPDLEDAEMGVAHRRGGRNRTLLAVGVAGAVALVAMVLVLDRTSATVPTENQSCQQLLAAAVAIPYGPGGRRPAADLAVSQTLGRVIATSDTALVRQVAKDLLEGSPVLEPHRAEVVSHCSVVGVALGDVLDPAGQPGTGR
jgi:hypothetical protein